MTRSLMRAKPKMSVHMGKDISLKFALMGRDGFRAPSKKVRSCEQRLNSIIWFMRVRPTTIASAGTEDWLMNKMEQFMRDFSSTEH